MIDCGEDIGWTPLQEVVGWIELYVFAWSVLDWVALYLLRYRIGTAVSVLLLKGREALFQDSNCEVGSSHIHIGYSDGYLVTWKE